MRLVHTADWHLGQTLHGVSRTWEHERFLAWLLDLLEAEDADALVVAGDVFDVASPSSAAQEQYYRFLAQCRARLPHLEVVVVGGNHDSAARLDAPRGILGALGIHVVGGLEGALGGDLGRLILPLKRRDGSVGAHLLPVPFLRPRDLAEVAPEGTPEGLEDEAQHRLIEGHRALYRRLTDLALARAEKDQAVIATGHCYMLGGQLSELSERKVQMGNQHALPVNVFPRELAYVALGHLHRAQMVGGLVQVRYSGSPIPLSLTEQRYEHQVLRVELSGRELVSVEPRFVPRSVAMLSLPEEHAPLPEVLGLLATLPRTRPPELPPEACPYLEVKVALEGPNPRLRREIEEALTGAWVRLLRIDARRPERAAELNALPARDLGGLTPLDIFTAAHLRARGEAPSPALRDLFLGLLEETEGGAP